MAKTHPAPNKQPETTRRDGVQRVHKAFLQEHALRLALEEHTLFSITDRSGKIIEVNTGFCRISGYSREELLGQNHRILNSGVHPRSFWVEMWKTIAAGNPWRGEVCNRAKDGSLYWVDSTNLPWIGQDGELLGFISLRLDITEKKLGEEKVSRLLGELNEQRALLKTVIESVSDGIVAASQSGDFFIFNKAAAEILGKTSSDGARPTNWSEVHDLYNVEGGEPVNPEDLPLARALRGEQVAHHDLLVRRPCGDARISCNASPLISESHRGAVVTFRDVTEQESMRSRLNQAQKLESIGQLAAGVAHEINTPLQCVTTNIAYIDQSRPELTSVVDALLSLLENDGDVESRLGKLRDLVEQRRFRRSVEQCSCAIDDIDIAVRRVSEIVQAMKDVSHPGSAGSEDFDLNGVVRNAATITRNRWKRAAELNLELDPDLPAVFGRHNEISQVAINLIVNAADALVEQNGESGPLGAITVRTERGSEGETVFSVSDNGIGIPAEILPRVFDPFFTTKEVGKGTGQGLAICFDVVTNRHGGSIVAESQAGVGTTFTVRIPPRPESASEMVAETASAAGR